MFDGKWKSPHDGGNRINLYGCIRTRGGDDICYGNPGGKHTRGDVNRHWRVCGMSKGWKIQSAGVFSATGCVSRPRCSVQPVYCLFLTVILPQNTCQVNITQHVLLHRGMKMQEDTHLVGDSKIPSSWPWEGKSGSSQHKQGWQEVKHHFCICWFTVFFSWFEPSVSDKIRNKQWKTTEINAPDALFTWQAGIRKPMVSNRR